MAIFFTSISLAAETTDSGVSGYETSRENWNDKHDRQALQGNGRSHISGFTSPSGGLRQ